MRLLLMSFLAVAVHAADWPRELWRAEIGRGHAKCLGFDRQRLERP